MKRIVACLLLVCALLTVVPAAAFANPEPAPAVEQRTEVTEWHYRVYNGVRQKRLWSITQQRYLTDWIDYE